MRLAICAGHRASEAKHPALIRATFDAVAASAADLDEGSSVAAVAALDFWVAEAKAAAAVFAVWDYPVLCVVVFAVVAVVAFVAAASLSFEPKPPMRR